MITTYFRPLLVIVFVTSIFMATTLSLDLYFSDPEITKNLLRAVAVFTMLLVILTSLGIYFWLARPLAILESSLEINKIPKLKALKQITRGISQLVDSANTDSNEKITGLRSSQDRLAISSIVLETRIKQLEAEALEITDKYRAVQVDTFEVAKLCRSHLHAFRGFLNLMFAGQSDTPESNHNKVIQQFGERVLNSATHLGFLGQDLLELLGQQGSNTQEQSVSLWQLIDEVIDCLAPITPGTVEIVPLIKAECPASVRTCQNQLKSLLFHYLSHCLTDTSLDRVVITTSYNQDNFSLEYWSDEFPVHESNSLQRLKRFCDSGIASLNEGHLSISIKDPLWDVTRLETLNLLVVDKGRLWRESIALRLTSLGVNRQVNCELENIDRQKLREFDAVITKKISGSLLMLDLPVILIGTTKTDVDVHQVHSPQIQLRLQQKLKIILNTKESDPGNKQASSPAAYDARRSLAIANNDKRIAIDMLDMLIDSLPEDLKRIDEAFDRKDWLAVKEEAHRLAGALRFCCAPRLQQAVETLNSTAKSNQSKQLGYIIKNISYEANQFYSWYTSTEDPFAGIHPDITNPS